MKWFRDCLLGTSTPFVILFINNRHTHGCYNCVRTILDFVLCENYARLNTMQDLCFIGNFCQNYSMSIHIWML